MPKKMSLKQVSYDSIKDKILKCEYEPNSFLNEDLLCEELGFSRTPIRDALSRLEQEHLVTIMPKKGFIVAPLTINEINMVFEGRLLLEPYILLTYCASLSEETIDHMYQLTEEYRQAIIDHSSSIYNLDNEFHNCMIQQCTNRYLLRTYEDIHNQDCRLRILSGRANDKRLNETVEEHLNVLECLRSADVITGAELLKTHLIHSKASSFQVFMDGQGSL